MEVVSRDSLIVDARVSGLQFLEYNKSLLAIGSGCSIEEKWFSLSGHGTGSSAMGGCESISIQASIKDCP